MGRSWPKQRSKPYATIVLLAAAYMTFLFIWRTILWARDGNWAWFGLTLLAAILVSAVFLVLLRRFAKQFVKPSQ